MKKSMSKKVISLVMVGTILSSNAVYAKELIQKDESVYVTLGVDGEVKEKIVSDWLHRDDAKGSIEDKTVLKDIKNVKGEEKPDIDGEKLTWNTDKKDIFYQGKTEKELPIKVSIKYELDGQEVNPKDIVGKSGQIKIKVNYENKSYKTVNIKGEERKIYTPFTTATIVNLPMDKFSNVKVNSGEVVSDGNNQAITFIALPGLKESLSINKDVEDLIDLKDSLEITAEVKNFEMGPIMMTATPKIPEVKEFKDAKNFDELFEGLDKLKDASTQLEDGSFKLKDGSQKLKDGLNEANNKVSGVKGMMNKEQDKIALIKSQENVEKERKLIEDAFFAKDLGKVFQDENVEQFIEASLADYKKLGIKSIMQLPSVKELKKKENLNNMTKLMNDADKLSNIGMGKLQPLMGVLKYSDSLVGLANKAATLYNGIELKKIDPLINLAQNKDVILKMAKDANELGTYLKAEQLKPIMGLANNKDKANGLINASSELSKVNLDNMKQFLEAQNTGAMEFINATKFLEKDKGQILIAKVKENPSLTDDEKTQLITIIGASSQMRNGLIASAPKLDEAKKNLEKLSGLQANLKEVAPLLAALPASMDYVTSTVMPKANELFKGMNGISPYLKGVEGSVQYIDAIMPQLKGFKGELDKNKEGIEAAQKALKPENLKYIEELKPVVLSMEANKKNIANIKSLINANGGMDGTLNKINTLEEDINKAERITNNIEKGLAKNNVKNLSQLSGKIKSMQRDLNDSEKILEVMQSALEQKNVEQARSLINALPQLSNGVQQLAEGSNQLYDGLDTLSSGMKKFNDEGINKIYSELKGKTTDIEKLIDIKDNIVKLSDEYESFTGVTEDMEGKVKFVMKTDEIKLPDKKEEVKKEDKKEEGGFIAWIKNLFHIK
ncbi:hypothetical protein [Haloimpatiens lingqiaonensis]|uniref:hypothetical protein n=1 Tax=Haloimpatiens lingqiaonensis TaxID=1380675 RepID=UPI0010FCF3AC|nr:hypothetical protein [Haloimpatiens lingqiaonensis]